MPEEIRIDKWLWAVRIYKTRTQATDACKKGRIIINKIPVKPSHIVKIDETIQVKKQPVIYTYRIKSLISNRTAAKYVNNFLEDLTPEEEIKKLTKMDTDFYTREKGTGRPTKQERRNIDKVLNSAFNE